MNYQIFFDPKTFTFTYIIFDQETKKAAILDSALDFDPKTQNFSSNSADKIIEFINKNNLKTQWILETHIHADHISAARYLKEKLGGKIAISDKIKEVAEFWAKKFNLKADISNFDHLFSDEEEFAIGNLTAKFLYTPGHTPSCSSFIIQDHIFVGDLLLMPNFGVGRADFPGGSAGELFDSIQKIFSYPDDYQIFTAHDYPKEGQKEQFLATILEHKQNNIFAKITDRNEFINKRFARDSELSEPKLLKYAIKENIFAGGIVLQ
jgi:glyoxylase-like metal-dependent hydrolase (beta-lactamase superfamily II)